MKAKSKVATPKQPEIALPEGITDADIEHKAPYDASNAIYNKWREANKLLDEPRDITMYNTERFGWVVTTLRIASGARRGTTDRSYGVTLEGNLVRVGCGPHVRRTITVYMRESRMEALQRYLELYNKGLENAHVARDTLSSRRAAGSLRRRFF